MYLCCEIPYLIVYLAGGLINYELSHRMIFGNKGITNGSLFVIQPIINGFTIVKSIYNTNILHIDYKYFTKKNLVVI